MGTLAEGIKEIFATAKTTGSNVMLCGNDGTPDGHMTLDNLASVLGGKSTELYNGVDFDTLVDGKNYFGYANVFANSSHTPNSIARTFKLFVNKDTSESYIIQTCFMYSGECFVRTRNNDGIWTSWHTIAIDYPSFYKDYNNLSALANALGGLYQIGVISSGDVNNLGSGIYGVNAQLTNAPENTGASMLIIMEVGWIRCDVILNRETAKLFYRFKWGSAGFEEWKLIS